MGSSNPLGLGHAQYTVLHWSTSGRQDSGPSGTRSFADGRTLLGKASGMGWWRNNNTKVGSSDLSGLRGAQYTLLPWPMSGGQDSAPSDAHS